VGNLFGLSEKGDAFGLLKIGEAHPQKTQSNCLPLGKVFGKIPVDPYTVY